MKRVVKPATKPITFKIDSSHVKKAKCKDPGKCVIAQAMNDHFGDMLEGVEVGATVTKVYLPGIVRLFSTPHKLKRGLQTFDLTGKWNLPEGEYTLGLPPAKRPSRWNRVHKTKSTPGRDMFGGRALPTRQISRHRVTEE